MITAKELLALIAAEPKDTIGLREIDAHVWCWINNVQLIEFDRYGLVYTYGDISGTFWQDFNVSNEYSTSRNALKTIRPERFSFNMSSSFEIYHAQLGTFSSPSLPTEELAELYAIILARAYERGEQIVWSS
jgi:hypothetical protein